MGAARVSSVADLACAYGRPIVASLHHAAGAGRRPAADTGHHHFLAKSSIDKLRDAAAGCTCVIITRV